MGVRTPEQVIRVFYEMYDSTEVRELLFEVFALLAVSERKGVPTLEGREDRVTLLFDQLVFLAEAVEKLRLGISDARHCAICGTEKVMPNERA